MEDYSFFAVLAFSLVTVLIMALPRVILGSPSGIVKNFGSPLSIREVVCAFFRNVFSLTMSELSKVRTTNPKKLEKDAYDWWFERHVEQLAHNGWCLSYIDSKSYLIDRLLSLLSNPDKNLKFQKLLISVRRFKALGTYQENFANILYRYAERWELLPEVLNILEKDHRFAAAKNIYERGRENAVSE